MPTVQTDERIDESLATTAAVVDAARDLARRYQITPRWAERLTPEAVRLVEAVIAHDRHESVTA